MRAAREAASAGQRRENSPGPCTRRKEICRLGFGLGLGLGLRLGLGLGLGVGLRVGLGLGLGVAA